MFQALKTASESYFGERGKNLRNTARARSWGGNPDEPRIEPASYWSHLLLRVKKTKRSRRQGTKFAKRLGHEFRGIANVNGGIAPNIWGLIFAIAFCTFLLENQTSIFREHSQAHRQPDSRCDRCGCMGDGCEDRIFRANQGAEGHRPDAGTRCERVSNGP